MPKTVAVPLDGSEFAERALAPAASIARQSGTDVVVMTSQIGGVVVDPHRYLTGAAAGAGISDARVHVVSDQSVVVGLRGLTADLDDPVVCMSTHGRTGLREALLGSKAEDALRVVGVPFLLVGPRVDTSTVTELRDVVVCTDGTPTSRAIVPEISAWIPQFRLRVWVVQVLDPEARLALEEAGEEPAIEVGAVHALAEYLLTRDGAGINWDVVHRDDAAGAIIEYARRVPASMIAMATHGRTGLARLAIGSVAASVVRDAPCPVLVVRPRGLAGDDDAVGEARRA